MKYTLCTPLPPSYSLKPDKPCAVSAGCSCSNHPRERTLARRPRNILSSPIQQQQQQQPLHIVYIRIGIGIGIGIALRLSSALYDVDGGEGDSRSLLLLASFLDSTLVLARGSWLALRHFLVSVCSKMHLVGYFRVVVCELLLPACLRLHCDFHGAHANVENAPLWH